MSNLGFTVVDARVEPYAIVPTLVFRLQIEERAGEQIHAIALRCQIQLEPRRRHYSPGEENQLLEIFGEPDRWSDTLRTLLWTHASLMVPDPVAAVCPALAKSCLDAVSGKEAAARVSALILTTTTTIKGIAMKAAIVSLALVGLGIGIYSSSGRADPLKPVDEKKSEEPKATAKRVDALRKILEAANRLADAGILQVGDQASEAGKVDDPEIRASGRPRIRRGLS